MGLETWATVLQASGLSQALRASIWPYPLVNTGHVVGIALLFGAIAPLVLQLMGCWKSVPLHPLARTAVPVAMAGLLLGVVDGAPCRPAWAMAGLVSVALWLGVITAGRLMGWR